MKLWEIRKLEPLRISEICEATKGKLMSGNLNTMVSGISTDSRKINAGEFFVPIKGENFDGHDFIQSAVDRGAAGLFVESTKVEKIKSQNKAAVIEVENAKYAMGELARYYRKRFHLPVIAITGSNGKTSTKEMTASILGAKYNVLKSEGSFNNDIGLPLTLFQLNKKHQMAVLEMGMNNYGEIRRMVSIIPPNIGVVTNVTETHIEFFGSLHNIAKAKFELLESMTEKNTAVLNADDSRVSEFASETKAKAVFFGMKSTKADFSASNIQFITDPYGLEFILTTPKGNEKIYLPVLGEHQVSNALASVAAAWQIDPDIEMIKEGLKNTKLAKMRMQIIPTNGFTIINDAYNASPKSMSAALDTLKKLPCKGKKIAVLADMLELGEFSTKMHQDIGKIAADCGLSHLITIGNMAKYIAQEAIQNGLAVKNVFICNKNKEAVDILNKVIQPGDLILLKGSRKMKLETIAEALNKQLGIAAS